MAVKFKSTININDQYTLPAYVGSDGQYLSITDAASGQLDWTNIGDIDGFQSNFIYYDAKNSTGSTIPVGTAVMAVGSDGNSGHILIAPMQANGTVEPKFFIGVTDTAIGNGEIGKVVHFGVIDQVNTNAFSDGDVLWCDPAVPGGFTTTEPEAPAVKLASAIVLNSSTNGKLLVRVQGNEGIHELHDVHIEDVTNGQALVWDATQGYWKNGDVASGGGGASTLNVDLITGDGTTTDFTLPQAVDSKDKTFVFLQGVYQEKSTYSLDGTTISFDTAPQNGYTVEVIAFASIGVGNVTKYGVSVISASETALPNRLYVLKADLTLTLPASPEEGDSIKISNLSGVATCVLGANGNNIMATASDLTLDDATKSFELIYTDATNGWVIIG